MYSLLYVQLYTHKFNQTLSLTHKFHILTGVCIPAAYAMCVFDNQTIYLCQSMTGTCLIKISDVLTLCMSEQL